MNHFEFLLKKQVLFNKKIKGNEYLSKRNEERIIIFLKSENTNDTLMYFLATSF